LGQREKYSLGGLAAVQLDHVSLHARDLIAALQPDLTRIADDNRILKAAANRLLAWDGGCAVSSIEAAIFHLMHQRLLRHLLIPVLGEEAYPAYVEILNQSIVPTDRIFAEAKSVWFSRRSRFELVHLALSGACEELEEKFGANMEDWCWGKVHQLYLGHALSRVDALKSVLGIGPMPTPGDGMTINVGFYRHSNPYAQTVGASLRFAVEMGPSMRSEFVLPSGQSGHPTSAHYRDQTELWLRGKTISFNPPAENVSSPKRSLRLNPR
jgi:penicillin amidase